MFASAAAVVVVAVGVATLPRIGSDVAADLTAPPGDETVVPANDTEAQIPTALPAGPLEWLTVDATLGWSIDLFGTGNGFYALSTAPGVTWEPNTQGRFPRAVYHSEDGVTWSHQLLGDDLWASGLAERGSTLYAVSTTPGVTVIDDIDLRIGASDDDGASWTLTDLPLQATAPNEVRDILYTSWDVDIAAAPAGVLAVALTNFGIDYYSLIPDQYQDGYFEAVPTDDGIKVIDYSAMQDLEEACALAWGAPQAIDETSVSTLAPVPPSEVAAQPAPCQELETAWVEIQAGPPVYEATWAELGLDIEQLHFAEMFFSADGVNFDPVDVPFNAADGVELLATDAGFIAIEYRWGATEGPNTRLWNSSDGRTWQPIDGLPDISYASLTQSGANGVLIVGSQSNPSGTDTPVVLWSPDGFGSWTEINIASLLPNNLSTANHWITSGALGPMGTAIAVNSQEIADGEEEIDGDRPVSHLLYSTDLTTWSVISIADLTGTEQSHVSNLVIGTDRILMRVNTWDPDTGNSTSQQLIGTPTD